MKRLFFLLCLLNVGFLFWQFHAGRLDTQTQKSDVASSLLLVSEYERARRGAVISGFIDHKIDQWKQAEVKSMLLDLKGEQWQLKAIAKPVAKKISKPVETTQVIKKPVEPAKPIVQVVEKICVEAGPFTDELSVKKWLTAKPLISSQIIQKDTAIPSDYQVYYPAAKTSEQSLINKAMLNAKGVQDMWLIPSGALKGAYSLGVFRDKQRALILRGQLAEKGIQTEIKQREKTTAQWFAKVMLDKAKLKQYQSAEVKVSSCSAN